MTSAPIDPATRRKPLRLWPGIVLGVLLLLTWLVAPLVTPDASMVAMLGGVAGTLLILLWWLLFSRARWFERLGAVALMVVGLAATRPLLHESMATAGMGMLFYIYAIPVLGLALVAWAVATRRLPDGIRRATMAATILLACGAFALIRTGGISGEGDSDLAWRWSPTPEERLLAEAGDEPAALEPAPAPAAIPGEAATAPAGDEPAAPEAGTAEAPAAAASPDAPGPAGEPAGAGAGGDAALAEAGDPATPAESPAAGDTPAAPAASPAVGDPESLWPGFRGPGRDGVARGVRIATDWTASQPVELWRRKVGPGWSSFAVRGDRIYTQEQRGEEEIVACYDAATGEPVWMHRDATRFWEANAGAGPRATPTLGNGRLYTLGATGVVNALDAGSGAVAWSRNAASDTGAEVPHWGFAGSPLVLDELVVVATAGELVAYDRATGEPRWFGPDGGWGYSSPHLLTVDGVEQVVLLNGTGAIGVDPADGTVLWQHEWHGDGIVQPALTADGDVLIGTGSGMGSEAGIGVQRVEVARNGAGWKVEPRWTSAGLKPYFNDFVVHEGHAYGFDGGILAAIDLEDGERAWKGGRYGHGQLVLLPEQDLLLVLSEKGELALVAATPERFTELARHPAIEGKTWNHPVLAGDLLLVRNAQEMVAFRLPRAEG